MHSYTAHITGRDGVAVRYDILAADLSHARQLAREQGAAAFGRGFTYCVRVA